MKLPKESLISVLADHYPQTLGSIILLRPPYFVYSLWNALKKVTEHAS